MEEDKIGKAKPGADEGTKFAEPGPYDLPEHLKPFGEFLKELNKESPRGCTLVSCSYLDELLKGILEAFFIEGRAKHLLSGFNAPLGTFSTRATAAHALGLITDEEFKEIDCLRKIRNVLAHGVGVSFATQQVGDLAKNLTMGVPGVGPRDAFSTAAVSVILNLTNRAVYVGRKRRKAEAWPI